VGDGVFCHSRIPPVVFDAFIIENPAPVVNKQFFNWQSIIHISGNPLLKSFTSINFYDIIFKKELTVCEFAQFL
jgi:hypothetical protein